MIIIFLGAPGSGKGTQARILSEKLSIQHLSTGDMLRYVSTQNSVLGNKIKDILSSGKLVEDKYVNEIVNEFLTKYQQKDFILDGYPRTNDQAKYLDKVVTTDIHAIYFDIELEKLKKRIVGRFSCKICGAIYNKYYSPTREESKCDLCQKNNFEFRSDDNEKVLLNRVEEFTKQIGSLVDYYSADNRLTKLDANLPVNEVTKLILNSIKKY